MHTIGEFDLFKYIKKDFFVRKISDVIIHHFVKDIYSSCRFEEEHSELSSRL
jgi:hypothetical protein